MKVSVQAELRAIKNQHTFLNPGVVKIRMYSKMTLILVMPIEGHASISKAYVV